jgi:DNA-binding GntR family transcriptional regulator
MLQAVSHVNLKFAACLFRKAPSASSIRGLDTLGELRALMAAVVQMARDEAEAATGQDLQTSLRNVREMKKIAEHHAIVLSCARSAADACSRSATKPMLH